MEHQVKTTSAGLRLSPPNDTCDLVASACRADTPMRGKLLCQNPCGLPAQHVELYLRPGNGSGIGWRSKLLPNQACLVGAAGCCVRREPADHREVVDLHRR
jgi:hypothetical protein